MTALAPAAALVVVCGVTAAVLAPVLLRHAAEPELGPDDQKVPYASLATTRTALGSGMWAAGLAVPAVLATDLAQVWPWLVVAVVGALASVVDISTTWIPRAWLHAGWAATALAVLCSAWAAGSWAGVWRAALGSAVVGGVYAAVYGVSLVVDRAFFGFADVRLGVLTGMAAGWRSVQTATSALVLGAAVGAAWGLVAVLRRRGSLYAYGPSIVLGPYLVLAVGLLTGA